MKEAPKTAYLLILPKYLFDTLSKFRSLLYRYPIFLTLDLEIKNYS